MDNKRQKKGTEQLRKVLNMGQMIETPRCQEKWTLELGIQTDVDWKYIYTLASNCKLNARCKYFQFQIIRRTLITNEKLVQFGR